MEQNPSARCDYIYELLIREATEAPSTTQAINIALGFSPGLDRNLILLKTSSHILLSGHREVKLDLSWKLLLYQPSFQVFGY